MSRKVIKLGKETFVVSLPGSWTRQHKLRKGDELEVEEAGPKLIIYPKSAARPENASINISGAKPMVKRMLGALYKVGYNEFTVQFESPEELASIKEVIAEFVGFELISEGKSQVVIRNISHIIPEEFDSIQRKMVFIISTMAEDGLRASRGKDWENLAVIASMDADVNRYADFCRRILNTVGHKVVKRVPPSYYIVEQLEKIGDSYRDLCRHCMSNKIVINDEIAALCTAVTLSLKKFLSVYSAFNVHGVTEFAKGHYDMITVFEKLIQKAEKKELPILILLKIAESDIFDLNGALLAEKL